MACDVRLMPVSLIRAVLMSNLYNFNMAILTGTHVHCKLIIAQNDRFKWESMSAIFVHLFKAINNSYIIAHNYLQCFLMKILVMNIMYSSSSPYSPVHDGLPSVTYF